MLNRETTSATETTRFADRRTEGTGVLRAIRVLALAWFLLSMLILWVVAGIGRNGAIPTRNGHRSASVMAGRTMVSIDFHRRSRKSVIEITMGRDFCHGAPFTKRIGFTA